MSLESFKSFVRVRPSLADYVARGEMTWQKFYDIYELYGDSSSVWNKYLGDTSVVTLKDMFSKLQNIDISEVQNSISSIQKGIGYIENLIKSKENEVPVRKTSYEARPLYKYFDD